MAAKRSSDPVFRTTILDDIKENLKVTEAMADNEQNQDHFGHTTKEQ